MEGRLTCGLWLLASLLGCEAFNLDTDNVQRKNGPSGSLFGFSLAMHRQLQPQDKRMLLVGAPKANATKGQTATVTGGLYSCDMGSTSTGCARVNFDDDENPEVESKENQWMGVTVKSQGPGGKIVTCAHRYHRRSNLNSGILGRCYVLSQNLKITQGSDEEGGEWQFCDGRPKGHDWFGSCQQGVSATFDRDYHYLIFGAPGAYRWKGIVRLEQRNESLLEKGIFDDGPYETGDENEKDRDLVPVPDNSYLGFSLDSGKHLTKHGVLTVVAGAPRANHSGAVVLLSISKVLRNGLDKEYILEGEGLASSFGYDLAVLDLNGDGWQDIVVGAPQYFEKDGEIGGAVYVYVNQAGDWSKVKPTRLNGPQDSMFGLAVESLGDINLDSYHDFAVGAPNADEGSGKVYIYSGSSEGLKSTNPLQVLPGRERARMFGYSLAGNMDLDKNSYPDLAVGSLSDSVFVFKSRPVINIKKEITFSPKEIDLSKKNCDTGFCMDIEACFTYTANPKSYTPTLIVVYSLMVDADLGKNGLLTRATFPSSSSDKSYESKGTITLNRKGAKQCVTHQLAIQDTIQDKLSGIPIDVSVNIQEAKRKRRQSLAPLSPVLDPKDAAITESKVNFLKEGCGKDNVCQSNLELKYRYGHMMTDGETFVPLELENGMALISLSNQKEITLEVTVTNREGDDAHEAHLVASFPRSLTYSTSRVIPTERQVNCQANKEGSKLDCKLGNPFKRDAEETIYINLGTAGISLNTSELEIDLQLSTTSEQQNIAPVKAKAKVAIMLQLSVTGQTTPSQVYFTVEAKDERAMKTESDAGSAITHQFRIINLGKPLKDFGSASLNIMWPKGMTKDKRLLYLMKISSTGVDKLDCTPKDEINSLGLLPSSTRARRATGSVKENAEGTISRFVETKKSISLSCESGVQCVIIKCPLRGLESNAVITVHSRLWNSTFIKDYSKMHHVDIIVKASLHVDSTSKNTFLKNADTQARLTVFPDLRAARFGGGVPWWIIVLSILFGLLLLGLLAFLLWKCGFFNCAKYEDKVPSYNAVRIKQERAINAGNGNWGNLEKKPWITTWHDSEHYS